MLSRRPWRGDRRQFAAWGRDRNSRLDGLNLTARLVTSCRVPAVRCAYSHRDVAVLATRTPQYSRTALKLARPPANAAGPFLSLWLRVMQPAGRSASGSAHQQPCTSRGSVAPTHKRIAAVRRTFFLRFQILLRQSQTMIVGCRCGVKIDKGCFLGYHRTDHAGTWIARWRDEDGRQHYQAIGPADDIRDPDGVSVLTFSRAQRRAHEFFDHKARELEPRHLHGQRRPSRPFQEP
jgi:hypothetical protein